jgi:hypothetical protein
MAGTAAKNKAPEQLSDAIADFDKDLCSETFLRELQGVLPNDDDVSQSLDCKLTVSGASFSLIAPTAPANWNFCTPQIDLWSV